MKVLVDECVAWQLARYIAVHDVKAAPQQGWSTIKNGELPALATIEFGVFVTVDQNISFQQNCILSLIRAILATGRRLL